MKRRRIKEVGVRVRRESSENIGYDPFNQNSNQSDQEKWSISKSGPVFLKLFQLDWTDPLSLGPKFPETLVSLPPPPTPIIFCFNLGSAFAALELLGRARFGRCSFHEPSIKYIKGSSESIKEHLFQFGTAQQFFTPSPARNFDCGTTLERFWFRRRTFLVPNLMHKL